MEDIYIIMMFEKINGHIWNLELRSVYHNCYSSKEIAEKRCANLNKEKQSDDFFFAVEKLRKIK